MRVSPSGYYARSLDEALQLAEVSASVTHNHPEGIKGAQATAAAIFMARQGASKQAIREYVEQTFDYRLDRTLDEIRPNYYFNEICQETVPEAITCYLEGKDFEDVVRLCVTLAGDADTLAAIAGGIAAATMDVPDALTQPTLQRLDDELLDILQRFNALVAQNEAPQQL